MSDLKTRKEEKKIKPDKMEQQWALGLAHLIKASQDYVIRAQEDFSGPTTQPMHEMLCQLYACLSKSVDAMNTFLKSTIESKKCSTCQKPCDHLTAFLLTPPLCESCHADVFMKDVTL